MLIAIDHGNYAVKTPSFSFVSGLSEHTVKPPLTDEIIEYAGRYWTLSGKRLNYMRDKTRDERYFILSLFAIAKELEVHGSGTGIQKIDLSIHQGFRLWQMRFPHPSRKGQSFRGKQPAPHGILV